MSMIISELHLVMKITDFQPITKGSKEKHPEQFMPQEI